MNLVMGSLRGWSGGCGRAVVVGLVGGLAGGLTNCFSSGVVFVVGGDVADPLMQPDTVVVDPDAVQFSLQQCRVGDRVEVRPFTFDVSEERFDPRLVGGGVGAAVVLGDGHQGHVGAGVMRRHRGAVELSIPVKVCGRISCGSGWEGNGRCLGALIDSFFGPLVPSRVAAGGGHRSPCCSGGGGDGVAVSDDRSSLGLGDRGAVDILELVAGVGAEAGGDAGEQRGGDVAERGVVVFAFDGHQPVVAGCEGGVDLAGVVGGEEQGFA